MEEPIVASNIPKGSENLEVKNLRSECEINRGLVNIIFTTFVHGFLTFSLLKVKLKF